MKGYAFMSTPLKPQRMLDETRAGKPEGGSGPENFSGWKLAREGQAGAG